MTIAMPPPGLTEAQEEAYWRRWFWDQAEEEITKHFKKASKRDLKRVRAWRKKGGTKRDRDGPKMDARSRADWPRDRPNFLKFTLYKENVDTMHAVSLLARALRCKPTSLGYAGTKDKRGATTQEVTVFKRTPEAVARALSLIHI